MKRTLLYIMVLLLLPLSTAAQHSEITASNIRTLQLTVNNNALLAPVLTLGSNDYIRIEFDDMTPEYHRYIYRLTHCRADWAPSQEIFESDYMEGFNNRPIDDYERSFNTTIPYTHYSLTLPNEDVRMKLSGNYRLEVFYDETDKDCDTPVLTARFCIVEPRLSVMASMNTNTDIDFNRSHQQMDINIGYAGWTVVSPEQELNVVVLQNRRLDNAVYNPKPTFRNGSGLVYQHCRDLIFPAGNEFHKFELRDVHITSLGVNEIEWIEPYYHALLFPNEIGKNYVYTEDQNGLFYVRSDEGESATRSEYVVFHFFLLSPEMPGGDVYIQGGCTQNRLLPDFKMTYNREGGYYQADILLKQGYYNYQYLYVPSGETVGQTAPTEGDFFQTENEYSILVYHRKPGERYDRLVGYRTFRYTYNK